MGGMREREMDLDAGLLRAGEAVCRKAAHDKITAEPGRHAPAPSWWLLILLVGPQNLDRCSVHLGLGKTVRHSARHVKLIGCFGEVHGSGEGHTTVGDVGFDFAGGGIVIADKIAFKTFCLSAPVMGVADSMMVAWVVQTVVGCTAIVIAVGVRGRARNFA